MRSMTDTHALRDFSAMLDAVEQGEEILVIRDGTAVARLVPERLNAADRIAEAMAKYPLPPEAVDDLENAVKELREWHDQEREWPDD